MTYKTTCYDNDMTDDCITRSSSTVPDMAEEICGKHMVPWPEGILLELIHPFRILGFPFYLQGFFLCRLIGISAGDCTETEGLLCIMTLSCTNKESILHINQHSICPSDICETAGYRVQNAILFPQPKYACTVQRRPCSGNSVSSS